MCVIAGDIHYNLNNLELADKATRMAIAKANELSVPFIANGDTTDHKAVLRAECVNAMIDTFKTAEIMPYVNIGNHCKISAKGKEHALRFLEPFAHVVAEPTYFQELQAWIVPYHDDVAELRAILDSIAPVRGVNTLIMHQGLLTSNTGHYMQDHSALKPDDLCHYRTILSHYHAHQDIQCGKNVATYIGSPYTVTFGEARDPAKGFGVLYDDGSLEFIPTGLRKHIIIELYFNEYGTYECDSEEWITPKDIVWIKCFGPDNILEQHNKARLAAILNLESDFKLDLIPTDATFEQVKQENQTQEELLDSIIDGISNSDDTQKQLLKKMWREFK